MPSVILPTKLYTSLLATKHRLPHLSADRRSVIAWAMVDATTVVKLAWPKHQDMSLLSSKTPRPQSRSEEPQPKARFRFRGGSGATSNHRIDEAPSPLLWRGEKVSATCHPGQTMRDCSGTRNGPAASGASVQAVANRPHRLLVVAPDFLMRHRMVDDFENRQLRATSAAPLREAASRLAADEPDLVVLSTSLVKPQDRDPGRGERLAH
jgi:hypothetical protein